MGCKCANSPEEEEEIQKNALENGNEENNDNDYNKAFKKNENLLGLNDQDNQQKEENKIQQNSNIGNNEHINEDINNNNINNLYDPKTKYEDYPEKMVELINSIRGDPVGYADVIEESIQNIQVEEDKNNPSNMKLIYKKKVKVALNRGEDAFREAAQFLRSLTPLPPLAFSSEKCIPLPETEDELKDPTFLREQVEKMRGETQIDVFFKDLVKIPEVSGLLMIVDDTNKNIGKKRMTLLNKNLKYIGVNSKLIGKTFIAYFSFSR
jgi:hypothetical protein